MQLCSSWHRIVLDVALGRKLERLWRNWCGQIPIPPSLQHASTGFYQYRKKALWTIKFSRYIDVTIVSWVTVSTRGGGFLSEDPQIVCEYIVHWDKAASLHPKLLAVLVTIFYGKGLHLRWCEGELIQALPLFQVLRRRDVSLTELQE